MIQTKPTCCPYCDSRFIVKKGVRKNTTRQLQLYRCTACYKYFTQLSGLKTKYSPELIARALLLFYQGQTQEAIVRIFKAKYKVRLSRHTLGRWVGKYKRICTFYPLRHRALNLFAKEKLITQATLEHRQMYIFEKHEAKVQQLCPTLGHKNGEKLNAYLDEVMQSTFPHPLFRDEPETEANNNTSAGSRSSQVNFVTLPFVTQIKQNTANDLATFGLYLAKRAVERHPMIEEFMLYCDGATVAVEIPVYLTNDELAYFQRIGFYLPLKDLTRPITGHIDILQIRNGRIRILDYKPEAKKINPVNQLLLYALALASRTRLPLKLFVCAWFDEKDYFEFYPLQAVYPKKRGEQANAIKESKL
jgi:transposase-like protein